MIGNRVCFAAPVLLFLGIIVAGCSKDEETAGPEYPEAHEVVYSFRLQNNTGRELPMANIALYLPMARSSSQNLLEFSVAGTLDAPYRHVEDEAGNSSVFYELKDLPSDFTRTVRLQARVGFTSIPHEIDVPDLQRYLEVPAEASGALTVPSFEFSEEEDTGARLLKIAAALSPPASAEQNAVPAVDSGCIERVAEFTRLARLNQIAVRPVVGFRILASDGEQKPGYRLYCWAEYYDQKRWQALDVVEATPVQNVSHYVALRNFYSLRDFRQPELRSLAAEGFGLTIELEMLD